MSTPPTLAQKLGMTEHVSPLLMGKVANLALDADSLVTLAIQRGCDYYHDGKPLPFIDVAEEKFSNAELAISLLHPSHSYNPQRIRVGAAMLGASENSPKGIADLAAMEHCECVVRYIAECGRKFEPQNSYWVELLRLLPELPALDQSVLPHPTRFVAMTGFTRRGRELITQWIRPGPTPAVVHG